LEPLEVEVFFLHLLKGSDGSLSTALRNGVVLLMLELPSDFLSVGVVVAVLQLLFFAVAEALALDPHDGGLHENFSSVGFLVVFSDAVNVLFTEFSHVPQVLIGLYSPLPDPFHLVRR
jgi:hypothetical protein